MHQDGVIVPLGEIKHFRDAFRSWRLHENIADRTYDGGPALCGDRGVQQRQ